MKIFSALYERTLEWSKHRFAAYYLGALSLFESIFFPIPPDVMLAPMSLSQPNKAWRFATITSVASIVGGVIGYLLGATLFDPLVAPLIEQMGYQDKFSTIVTWFEEWGIWVVFLAGFSPIPYKLFTVSAGMLSMAFLPFVLASAVSRGLRFFLVAGLIKQFGAAMESKLRKYIDILGWGLVAIIAIYIVYKQLFG